MRKTGRIAGLLFVALASFAPLSAARDIRVGILAPDGPQEAARDWSSMASHFAQALPEHQFHWRYLDLASLKAAAGARNLDFAITNSGHYVELEATFGAYRIATLERAEARSPRQALASAIVVRAVRRDLGALADLRGQRVGAVAENAFGGYQIAWHALRGVGIEPRRDFAVLEFAGFPQQSIVRAVAAGRLDAGIVRACLLEGMARRGELRLEDFRVLGAPPEDDFPCLRSTPLYPDWPFAAFSHTPLELSRRIATALLAMPRGEGQPGWTVPTDYQPVHEVLRALGAGPYAGLEKVSLGVIASRYRWWLIVLALLILGGLAHTLRADQMVKRRTRELIAQQEKLDHLGRLGILGELSSMLAHELNQPLAAIANFARGMERRIETGNAEPSALLEASREIAEQAERARSIMQRIRGFARKRQGERVPVRLADTVDGALALLAGIGVQAPPVRVRIDASARVLADPLQLEEVVLNLLKNAFDALELRPAPERLIEVASRRREGSWELCVRDNGCGLDAAARARLFEPFFTTKPDGLGLGLAICQTIVEAHGGWLRAEPGLAGRGLGVCIALPAFEEAFADA